MKTSMTILAVAGLMLVVSAQAGFAQSVAPVGFAMGGAASPDISIGQIAKHLNEIRIFAGLLLAPIAFASTFWRLFRVRADVDAMRRHSPCGYRPECDD